MKKLLTVFLITMLSTPLLLLNISAQPKEPSVTFSRAGYSDSRYTGFNITAPTQDNGMVNVIFAWEIASTWRGWREGDLLRVYDTYPTLQMLKFLGDGSLDYSLTYIPLYLIQFEDANENGLFDVQTQRSLTKTLSDEEVDWKLSHDSTLSMYPLAPMITRFELGDPAYTWSWSASDPTKAKAEESSTPEYVWNLSASVESYGWRFIDDIHRVERSSIDVHFGYRLSLKPEGPKVKLEYGIGGATWASDGDINLAIISAVIYHSKNEIVVKEEGEYKDFSGASTKDWKVALVESAGESVRSLIASSPDAVVDGINRTNVVTSALQPVFIVSTPPDLPESVNVRGLNPRFGETAYGQYSVTFAHQLAFPRFEETVFQDPVISLLAPLLIPLPPVFTGPQWFIVASVAVITVYALLRATLGRSLREPFMSK